MSKQMPVILGVLAATFLAGVGIGYILSHDPSRSDVTVKSSGAGSPTGFYADSAAQDREQGNTLLSTRIRELEKELADVKTDQRTILSDRLAFFKKYHVQIQVRPFDQSLHLTPEMKDLLDLSPEQAQKVEQALAQAKVEMDAIEDANTTVTKQTASSVAFSITADPKGKALKDNLTDQLATVMGSDQTDVFMKSAPWSFEEEFSGFSDSKKEMELMWSQQNGRPYYTVSTKIFNADGTSSGSSSTSGSFLQPQYQKYLPTDAPTGP